MTSVYGPLATLVQELAARLGGGSMHDIVFWLALLNAAAYVGAGALLVIAAGADPARRARAALFWAANPLLIYVVVGGAHLDAQAIVLAVAALALLRRSPLGAGLLLGLAGAVKISLGLWGLGFLWALRRRPKDALLLCVGRGVVAGADLRVGGRGGVHAGAGQREVRVSVDVLAPHLRGARRAATPR